MTQRPRRNKSSIVIEPFKQIKLGVYIMLISLAFVILDGWLVYRAFAEQYQQVMQFFGVVDEAAKEHLINNEVFYDNAMWIGLLFIAYLILLFAVIFNITHRYYGPLVSIERFVEQITDGDYKARVSIRRKDELQDLVSRLNEMAEKLEERHK